MTDPEQNTQLSSEQKQFLKNFQNTMTNNEEKTQELYAKSSRKMQEKSLQKSSSALGFAHMFKLPSKSKYESSSPQIDL
jgi:hypothetical protein